MTRQRQAAQRSRAAAPKQTLGTSHLQSQLSGLKRKAAARKVKLQSQQTTEQGTNQDLSQNNAGGNCPSNLLSLIAKRLALKQLNPPKGLVSSKPSEALFENTAILQGWQ